MEAERQKKRKNEGKMSIERENILTEKGKGQKLRRGREEEDEMKKKGKKRRGEA